MRYRRYMRVVCILMAMCVLLSGCGSTKKSKSAKKSTTAKVSMASSVTVDGADEEEDIDISAILATTNRKINSSGLEVNGTTAATKAKPTSATTSAPTKATRATTAAVTTSPIEIALIEPATKIEVEQTSTEPVTEASTEAATEEPTEASTEMLAQEDETQVTEETSDEAVMEVAGYVPSTEAQTEETSDESVTFTNGYQHEVEMRIEELINEERESLGLTALVHNSELYTYSQGRCIDIMTDFSHDGNDSSKYGENIHMNSGYNFQTVEEAAQFIYEAWYNSSSHHINYLRSIYVSSSVAIYYEDGSFYAVHTFALN